MKSIGVKMNKLIDFDIESNHKSLEFGTGYHVRISKCKNIVGKGYPPNWSEGIFRFIKSLKKTHV